MIYTTQDYLWQRNLCYSYSKLKKSDFCREIRKIIGDDLDVFIDNTGSTEIIEKGYQLIHKEGRLILVGVPKIGQNINIFSLPLHFGKQIIGSFGGECNPQKIFQDI